MYIVCPNCRQTCEADNEPVPGRHLLCPFCNKVFSYRPHTAEEDGLDVERGNDIVAPRYRGGHSEIGSEDVPQRAVATTHVENTIKSINHKIKLAKKARGFYININQTKEKACVVGQDTVAENTSLQNIKGCLPTVLFVISAYLVVAIHHWVSVLIAVPMAFAAILMHIYKKLCKQMGGRATKQDFIKRLGVGAPSVFLCALVLGSCLIMYSCDRFLYACSCQEKEWSLQAEFAKNKWVDYAMRKHALCYVTCDMCDFRETRLLNINESLNIVEPITRERCPQCRHWLFYNTWQDRQHFQKFYERTKNEGSARSMKENTILFFIAFAVVGLIVIVAVNKSRKNIQ